MVSVEKLRYIGLSLLLESVDTPYPPKYIFEFSPCSPDTLKSRIEDIENKCFTILSGYKMGININTIDPYIKQICKLALVFNTNTHVGYHSLITGYVLRGIPEPDINFSVATIEELSPEISGGIDISDISDLYTKFINELYGSCNIPQPVYIEKYVEFKDGDIYYYAERMDLYNCINTGINMLTNKEFNSGILEKLEEEYSMYLSMFRYSLNWIKKRSLNKNE